MGWTKTFIFSLASGSVNVSIFTCIVQRNLDCPDVPENTRLINDIDDLVLIRQDEKKGLRIKPMPQQ